MLSHSESQDGLIWKTGVALTLHMVMTVLQDRQTRKKVLTSINYFFDQSSHKASAAWRGRELSSYKAKETIKAIPLPSLCTGKYH